MSQKEELTAQTEPDRGARVDCAWQIVRKIRRATSGKNLCILKSAGRKMVGCGRGHAIEMAREGTRVSRHEGSPDTEGGYVAECKSRKNAH